MTYEHWHVASGIAGYGPDAADTDGFFRSADVRRVADAIRSELSDWMDYGSQTADAAGDAGDYETFYRETKRTESLDATSHNFDNVRADAPLYRGDPDAWRDTLERMIGETFPLDVSDASRLYVWQCTELDCLPTGEIITNDDNNGATYAFEDGSRIAVQLTSVPDPERRAVALWQVIGADGQIISEDIDLRSGADGIGAEPAELLRTLASFLSACAESRQYETRTGSTSDDGNSRMFPALVGQWAEDHSDDLAMVDLDDNDA